eukprot:1155849-Pelagomonas_calceolata.AAC.2
MSKCCWHTCPTSWAERTGVHATIFVQARHKRTGRCLICCAAFAPFALPMQCGGHPLPSRQIRTGEGCPCPFASRLQQLEARPILKLVPLHFHVCMQVHATGKGQEMGSWGSGLLYVHRPCVRDA